VTTTPMSPNGAPYGYPPGYNPNAYPPGYSPAPPYLPNGQRHPSGEIPVAPAPPFLPNGQRHPSGEFAVGYPPGMPPGYPPQAMRRPMVPPQAMRRPMPAPMPLPLPFAGRHKRHSLEHRDVTGGALRAAVFGAMDGLVTNASLIAGAAGAHSSNHTIVLTGFAGLVAGAFSMATGEYISVSSQNEMTESEVDSERLELAHNPARELAELTEVYVSKGVQPQLAAEVARQLSVDPEQALQVHAREELGVDPDDLPSPWTAAGASFAFFTGGALTPLLPFLIGFPSFALALTLASIALLVGGGVVAKAAKRSPISGGLRQFALGVLGIGMTFLVGQLVGVQTS
jgi:vacuolar iron transporter family protein